MPAACTFAPFKTQIALKMSNSTTLNPSSDTAAINRCTYPTDHRHIGRIEIHSQEQLSRALQNCVRTDTKWHVISGGKNWGYGSQLGHGRDTVLLDLQAMKAVKINESHQYAVIEAGVTQQDLYEALIRNKSSLMLPVTGSSADSSILGNAITMGYANGRSTLRIQDVIQAEGFDALGRFIKGIDAGTCKYRPNAALGKLLSQAQAGSVITRAKMYLPKIPQAMLLVSFSLKNKDQLCQAMRKLIQYKSHCLIAGNWSIFTAHRLLAEKFRKCTISAQPDMPLSFADASDLLKFNLKYRVWNGAYNGVFACYLADASIAAAASGFIRKDMQDTVSTLEIIQVSGDDIRAERDHGTGFSHIDTDEPVLSRLRTFSGILRNGSIDIAYWKKQQLPHSKSPDTDDCGFIWSAQSAPNDEHILMNACDEIEKTLYRHNVDPIYVIDGVLPNETYFMTSVIFDKCNHTEMQASLTAYDALNHVGINNSLVNFRKPVPVKVVSNGAA